MSKIFVDVHTPGNGKTYEFRLDGSMTVGQAKERIVEEILGIENNGISFVLENTLLGDVNTKQKLPEHLSLHSANVKSGHNLVLV
jgi:hypothetical protein